MDRTMLVAGNWKMNGNHESIEKLLNGIVSQSNKLEQTEVAVCSPAVYLAFVEEKLKGTNIKIGAQNVSNYEPGAYTGEISVSMLEDFDIEYIIIGHSERRELFGDTNEIVAQKIKAVSQSSLTPILCVGEKLEDRESNTTSDIIIAQIQAVIDLCGIDVFKNMVVAYEPVWAIGTGVTATPEQAQEVHALIRETIAKQNGNIANFLRILYGGSVKPSNAKEIFAMKDIDGGLIGGASLVAEDFIAICEAAQ